MVFVSSASKALGESVSLVIFDTYNENTCCENTQYA